jgi:hypothetical protein
MKTQLGIMTNEILGSAWSQSLLEINFPKLHNGVEVFKANCFPKLVLKL